MAEINPILRTPPEEHNEVEIIKRRGLKAPPLEDRLGDPAVEDVIDELKEQTKPLGLYVQTLRDPETGKLLDDLTGTNKKQRLFLVRVTIPLLCQELQQNYTKCLKVRQKGYSGLGKIEEIKALIIGMNFAKY